MADPPLPCRPTGESFRAEFEALEARVCGEILAFERRMIDAFGKALAEVMRELQANREKVDEIEASVRSVRSALDASIAAFEDVISENGEPVVVAIDDVPTTEASRGKRRG